MQIHLAIASWIHSYFDNAMMKFMINNKTDARKTQALGFHGNNHSGTVSLPWFRNKGTKKSFATDIFSLADQNSFAESFSLF